MKAVCLLICCLCLQMAASAQYNWQQTSIPHSASRFDDQYWLNPDKGWVIDYYGGKIYKTTDGAQT